MWIVDDMVPSLLGVGLAVPMAVWVGRVADATRGVCRLGLSPGPTPTLSVKLWFARGKGCGPPGSPLGTARGLVPRLTEPPRRVPSGPLRTHSAMGTATVPASRDGTMSSTIHTPYYLY